MGASKTDRCSDRKGGGVVTKWQDGAWLAGPPEEHATQWEEGPAEHFAAVKAQPLLKAWALDRDERHLVDALLVYAKLGAPPAPFFASALEAIRSALRPLSGGETKARRNLALVAFVYLAGDSSAATVRRAAAKFGMQPAAVRQALSRARRSGRFADFPSAQKSKRRPGE